MGNNDGVIYIIHRVKLHQRIVADKVVQALGAHQEVGHADAGLASLFAVGDDAALHQIHDTVGEHIGVDPQIFFVAQAGWNMVK